MKILVGCVAATGVLLSTAVQAQTLLPARNDTPMVVRVSDFGGPYAAMPREYVSTPRYGYAPTVLPPREVYAILREAGYSPLGIPQQRGLVYTVSAIDRDGEDGRMVIDARSGRILRFMPAYRMGSRMDEETVASYGPEAALPPAPFVRRETRPPVPAAKIASRTTAMPLPKAPPARAVAQPAHPVAATANKPVAVAPTETAPATTPATAPVQQSAVTETKSVDAKTTETRAPETTGAAPATTPPTVSAPPVEAKPATPDKPADTPPPVQGLE